MMPDQIARTAAERTAALVKIVLTEEQRQACRYLELMGLRFCVDFGTTNCVALAAEHFATAPARVIG